MTLDRVVEVLRRSRKLVIASHVNPEADAIGSIIALGSALEEPGREIHLFNPSGLPRNLKDFPLADRVQTVLPNWRPDVLAVLDCGDFDRIGKEAAEALGGVETILNIDHHSTNVGFGHVQWLDADSSSTGEMVVELIDRLGAKWTPEMAEWLLAAMVADTGSFQFSNSSEKAFRTAGILVSRGASPPAVARRLFGNVPESNLRLLGMVLSTLETDHRRGVAFIRATTEMFRDTGSGPDAVEGFIEYPRSLEGIEVAVLLRQTGPRSCKVSMRSKGAVDVGRIAFSFGGGGHSQAAGFSIEADFDETRRRILEALDGGGK